MSVAVRVGQDLRWWRAERLTLARTLWAYKERLEEREKDVRRVHERHARLYGNHRIVGLRPNAYSRATDDDRMKLNIVASVIDTVCAKIAQARPAPQFLTSGADYDLRRKTDKLNKFGKGMLHSSGFYRGAPQLFRDAAIFGTGLSKIYSIGKRIVAERTFPWELLIDQAEAFYGEPRNALQRKFVDRDVLLETYGKSRSKAREAIIAATPAPDAEIGRDPICDQVEVIEAWHLPSGEGAGDGRHVIAIENFVFVDEEWEREALPFVVYRWSEPIVGFWGRGAAEKLTPIQFELNTLLQKIQRAFHLLGVPRVFIDQASGVPKTHINNEIGAIISLGPGQAPVIAAPQTIHPEVFAHLNWLYQRAFEEEGVSQLDAQSRKPAGLDSGVALREYDEIKSERFILHGRRYEDAHLDAVRLGLSEARTIRGFSVDVPDRNAKDEIAWKDVSLRDNEYVLQCFPASSLPQTPAGRRQEVQELVASGLIPQDRALELLDMPDLEEMGDSMLSPRRALRKRIADMLDGGEYVSPEPFDDLKTGVEMTRAAYLEEREHGCPEDRLEMLRRFIDECVALGSRGTAPDAASAPPGAADASGGGAPGGPMPIAAAPSGAPPMAAAA